MKDEEEFNDVPNDYIEERISRLEKKVLYLSILGVFLIGSILIILQKIY